MNLVTFLQVALTSLLPFATGSLTALLEEMPHCKESCDGESVTSKRPASPLLPRNIADVSFIQVGSSHIREGSQHRAESNAAWHLREYTQAAPKTAAKNRPKAHLAETKQSHKHNSKQSVAQPADVVGESESIGSRISAKLKEAGENKVVGFVVALVLAVCVVVYCFVIRPRLGTRDNPLLPGCESSEELSHSPSRVARVPKDAAAVLCPSLVVPPMQESWFVLPDMVMTALPFHLSDLDGEKVLQVIQKSKDPWEFELAHLEGDVLCKCYTKSAPITSQTEYHFLRESGDYFAKLQLEDSGSSNTAGGGRNWQPDNYLITMQTGTRLQMSVSHEQLIDLYSDGQLLASMEPSVTSPSTDGRGQLRLRVAPGSDAGLAVCAVLCVGHHARELRVG